MTNMPNLVYERLHVFTIETVLPHLIKAQQSRRHSHYGRKQRGRILDQYDVKVTGLRLGTFKDSQTCAMCGLKASYFALERPKGSSDGYHLNMYGIVDINDSSTDVLFTKDHIVPLSKGGLDCFENMQAACLPCNAKKGNSLP